MSNAMMKNRVFDGGYDGWVYINTRKENGTYHNWVWAVTEQDTIDLDLTYDKLEVMTDADFQNFMVDGNPIFETHDD